jgi:hypothetical protein
MMTWCGKLSNHSQKILVADRADYDHNTFATPWSHGLVNLLARGEAAPDARPFFCGATLVALRKEDATHRPIAVGETIRRLVSKSLAMGAKADARDILEPLQVGVGTPGGVEAVPHVQYFLGSFALHSAYWHDGFGRPISHGCVNLSPKDAKHVFSLTTPTLPLGWLHGYESTEHLGTTLRVRMGNKPVRDRRGDVEPVFGR